MSGKCGVVVDVGTILNVESVPLRILAEVNPEASVTMDNYQSSLYTEAHMFRSRCPDPSMDTSFKVDEGYSEETRSHDGINTPTDLDLGHADISSAAISSMAGLPEWVLTLNEAERSGTITHLTVVGDASANKANAVL